MKYHKTEQLNKIKHENQGTTYKHLCKDESQNNAKDMLT